MCQTATLVAHRGAILVSRKELARYEAPEATATWKPVKHAVIVELMHDELGRRHIGVTTEEYAIQRDGNCLFAALTTNWLESGETAAALAFGHSHDKTEAMKMGAGVRGFICDNMALSGDEIIPNRRHTTRLNVATELAKAFERYQDGALILHRNIEDMKGGLLSDISIESMLFEIFYRRILPSRMLVPVADSFYSQSERTGWALLNACTLHAKNLPPSSIIRAYTRLGKYFGLGVANPCTC
jgi:hypothetical protein